MYKHCQKFALNENVSKLKNLNTHFTKIVYLSEMLLWCDKRVNVDEKPTEIMDVLDACDAKFYTNINFLLNIFTTLPVSTTAVDR